MQIMARNLQLLGVLKLILVYSKLKVNHAPIPRSIVATLNDGTPCSNHEFACAFQPGTPRKN